MSEEVNRKLPVRNATVKFSTDEHHNTLRHRQTDGQTDDITMTIADDSS